LKIIRKETLDSTNEYAAQLIQDSMAGSTFCVVADRQTSGKGRGSNQWNSEAGKNLTFSIVCFPKYLKAENQFYLNKAIALSVHEFVAALLPEKDVAIKWPNDIYTGNKKVAGTLIQVAVQGATLKNAIIGTGININQETFPENLPNATSVFLEKSAKTELVPALNQYIDVFEKYYGWLEEKRFEDIDNHYIKKLYRFGKHSMFEFDKKTIRAVICGVDEYGWLQLLTDEGVVLSGEMDKVKMIIEP
jgi:BirA family biotin operon repressor/biotin-[acetyl-CoA-carboxylase] ligase